MVAEAPTSVERRPVAGWRVVARKEFADHLTSARFLIVVLLLAVPGIAAVYAAASTIRDVAPQASGAPSLFLRLFTLRLEPTPWGYFNFVSVVGPLLGIAFGFDAINSERAQRTLPRLVAQPIHRDDVINGKFVAGLATIVTVLVTLTALVAGIGILRLGITPRATDVARLLAFLLVSATYLAFWLALALLLSVLLRRAATSALTALGVWLVLTLFAGLIVGILADIIAPVPQDPTAEELLRNVRTEQALGRLSPGFLYEEAGSALLTPELRTLGVVLPEQAFRAVVSQLSLTQSLLLVWPQIVALVAMTVVVFAAAYVAFLREEIRA